jgi:hypothetical protein
MVFPCKEYNIDTKRYHIIAMKRTMQNRYAVVLPGGGKELPDVPEVKIASLIETTTTRSPGNPYHGIRETAAQPSSRAASRSLQWPVLDGKPGGIKDGDGIRSHPFLLPNHHLSQRPGTISSPVDAAGYRFGYFSGMHGHSEIAGRRHTRGHKIVMIMYADTKVHIRMDSDESTVHPGI